MRKTLAILTLALVLTAVAPAAQADVDDQYGWAYLFAGQAALLSVEAGPNAVVFTLHDVTIDGDYARDARIAIDNFDQIGDGNGEVTDVEVVGAEALLQSTINSMLPQEFDFQMVTIDGRAPHGGEKPAIQMQALDIKGAEGPTSSTDAIKTDIKVKLLFESVDATSSSHTIRFENIFGDFTGTDVQDKPPVEIQVSGYGSWDIDAASIEPSAFADRLEGDTLTFTNADVSYFDDEDEGLQFVIQGDPDVKIDDTKDSPVFAPVVLLALLGAVVVALRRRR